MIPNDLNTFRGNHIRLTVDRPNLDIVSATNLAREKARELSKDAMMLSWYCGKTGEYYPKTECGRTDRLPWIVFAEVRGADIAISINEGEYVFLFLS